MGCGGSKVKDLVDEGIEKGKETLGKASDTMKGAAQSAAESVSKFGSAVLPQPVDPVEEPRYANSSLATPMHTGEFK